MGETTYNSGNDANNISHNASDIMKRFANDVRNYENNGTKIDATLQCVSFNGNIEFRTLSDSPERAVGVTLVGLVQFIRRSVPDEKEAAKMLSYVVNDLMNVLSNWSQNTNMTMQDLADNINEHPFKFIDFKN